MKGLEEIEIGGLSDDTSAFEIEIDGGTPNGDDGKNNDGGEDPSGKKDDDENLIEITAGNEQDDDEEDGDAKGNSSDGDPSGSGEPSSPLTSFASALHEKGVLTEFDDKALAEAEDPHEALLDMLDKEVNKRVEEYKSSLEPSKKEEIELNEKGIDVKLYNGLKSDIQFLENLKEESYEDKDLAKRLIGFDLADRGFTSEEIEEELNNYEDLGKLDAKAKKASERLLKSRKSQFDGLEQEAENQRKARQKKIDDDLKKLKSSVEESTELIPGIKLTDTAKKKLIDSLTKPKKVDGKLLTPVEEKMKKDPMKFDIMLHYMNMLGFFDGKFDSLITSSNTKAVKKFKDSLSSNTAFTSGKSSSNRGTDSDWLESLKNFSKTI